MTTISIKNDFSQTPNLRHCNISDKSGEEFYHSVLNAAFHVALEKKESLTIDLDGTDGYASSFLDEAFGNLVYDFTLANVEQFVRIISTQESHWKTMIEKETYPQWEERRKKNDRPKVTQPHEPWYRLVDNKLIRKAWESPA